MGFYGKREKGKGKRKGTKDQQNYDAAAVSCDVNNSRISQQHSQCP